MTEQSAPYYVEPTAQAPAVGDDLDHDFPEMPLEVKLPGGTVGETDPPAIPDEMQAERHLKAVGYYNRERARIIAHATAHRAQIAVWERAALRPIEARLEWHEGGLRAWLTASGRKAAKLVYGTVKRVAGRESVKIEDELNFMGWAQAEDGRYKRFVRVKAEPNKVAIAAHIKSTGEIPDGCALVVGEDQIKIETV